VKIRGNASHIAEKYITLARDALAASDTVMAENYLQHAEHYNRIIAAAQAQQQTHEGQGQHNQGGNTNGQANGQAQVQNPNRNRRRNQPNNQEVERPGVEADATTATPESPVVETQKSEDVPAKPARRRRAPRTKIASTENDTATNPGPVRMGDMPVDETAS